jgi:hypothetical protein
MKTIVSFLFLIAALGATAQTQLQQRWTPGFVIGAVGNNTTFSGGDIIADARFNRNDHSTGLIGMHWRYALKERWFLQAGVQLSSIGFSYGMSTHYSLNFPSVRQNTTETSFLISQVPVMLFHKFKPNCRNYYWIAGLGAQLTNTTAGSSSSGYSSVPETSLPFIAANTATENSISLPRTAVGLHAQFGIERKLKSGRILNVSLVFHKGFTTLAKSEVNYTFDGTSYMHRFENQGDYAGFTIGYFLKSFGKPKN